MKLFMIGWLACALAMIRPAMAAEPIAELRTNPACAAAFKQTVDTLGRMSEVGLKLVPTNPPTQQSCRDAREYDKLERLHLRLDTKMFAVCHQNGSTELAAEAARNAHVQQAVLPKYCR